MSSLRGLGLLAGHYFRVSSIPCVLCERVELPESMTADLQSAPLPLRYNTTYVEVLLRTCRDTTFPTCTPLTRL